MIKTFSRTLMIAFAFAAALLMSMPRPAEAQSASIEFKVFKAGFIVGVGGGSGTLIYQGQRYPLNIGGISLGASIGVTKANMVGEVYNLTNVADIVGTYTATSAGFAFIGGGKVASLKNSKGVVIKARGKQIGLAVSLDLNGLSINLK